MECCTQLQLPFAAVGFITGELKSANGYLGRDTRFVVEHVVFRPNQGA
jgi:hypothetical protein